MKKIFFFILGLAVVSLFWSCSDDTEVGYGVLADEELELAFRDDFDLKLRQLGPSPFSVPFVASNDIPLRRIPSRHSIGTLEDPRFGKFASSFYVRPIPGFIGPPEPEGATFDSLLFLLRIDTTTYYGNPNSFFNIDVFEVTEQLDGLDSSFTNRQYTTNAEPVGSVSRIIPANLDTVRLPSINTVDTTLFTDVISIKLNSRYANRLFSENQTLVDVLEGFYVQGSSSNTLLQFDLSDPASSLVFFYKDTSNISRVYPFSFGGFRPLLFEYDISGSNMEAAIDQTLIDDRYYIQGHAGGMLEIDLSDLRSVDDPFVNFVSLEFYVDIGLVSSQSMFPFPPALDLYIMNDNGELQEIFDLNYGQTIGQVGGVFDGVLEEVEEDIFRYEMNITTHVKRFLKDVESPLIYLTVRDRVDTPNNVIVYGPNHPTYRARLKLTYTKT